MAITLSNDELVLHIETAGERYTGSRFDWNGTVTGITYKKIPILGQEKSLFRRNHRIYGRGLHNEFGIKKCIGYDEVPVGGWFPKIGTGWLKKDSKPYFFYTQYELDRLTFNNYTESKTKVSFFCDSGERNGYAYRYTKTMELDSSGFSISYMIDNYGAKPLETTEYVHNFLQPGHHVINNHLVLQLGWAFDSERLIENVHSDGVLSMNGNLVAVTAKPSHEFFLGGLWQAQSIQPQDTPTAKWTLFDRKDNIELSETGSFQPAGCDLWGYKGSFSPELFYAFRIEAGNILTWSRKYAFRSII